MRSDQRLQEQRWHAAGRALPHAVRRLLETVDVPWLRLETLEEIEVDIFGWDERRASSPGRAVRLDRAAVHAAWTERIRTRPAETFATVRRILDENKRAAHFAKVQGREVGVELLPQHREPTPKEGVLTLTPPPHRRRPYFGVSGYLEATPVEVSVYVARFWRRRTGHLTPKAWDLTAGSCTVAEVLRTVFDAQVVATDIVGADSLDARADLREAGNVPQHRARRLQGEDLGDALLIESPNIIFVDPPSRGQPTHASLYLGQWPALDFAILDRDAYVGELLAAVVDASTRLAPEGVVSLLLREGVRTDQRVTPDDTLVSDFLGAASEFTELTLVDRFKLVEAAPVRQASLGTTRCPMTHLLFARTT